jgi:hypothetical protein
MATAPATLAYKFEVADEIQVYRPRPVKRYMICPSGGYYVKLEQLPDRSIIAVFKGGDGIVGLWGHLQCAISRDGGESWTPPRTIVQMDHDTDHMALGQTPDAALVLCFIQPHAYQNGLWDTAQVHHGPVYTVRSTDGGQTWTPPVTVDTSTLPVPDGFNPHGKMAYLPDGTLLMSGYFVYREGQAQASYQQHSLPFGTYVLRSRDGGLTWGDGSLLADGFVEPSLYVLPAGRLIGLVAQFMPGRNLWQTESDDGGYTWSAPRPITGYHEYSGSSLLLLHDGRLLLAYGHRSFPGGVRAMVSRDEGRTWNQEEKIMLSAESVYQFCGGGSSVQLTDGKILTAYFQHQGTGPFLHPRTYWVSAGFFSGPYAAVVKYDPGDLP